MPDMIDNDVTKGTPLCHGGPLPATGEHATLADAIAAAFAECRRIDAEIAAAHTAQLETIRAMIGVISKTLEEIK